MVRQMVGRGEEVISGLIKQRDIQPQASDPVAPKLPGFDVPHRSGANSDTRPFSRPLRGCPQSGADLVEEAPVVDRLGDIAVAAMGENLFGIPLHRQGG